MPEVNVVKIPDNVTFDSAAAASMTLLTSWHMLVGRAKIQPGQLVLIMGGGSGVGNYGIQIAKLFGCTVIATASPDKLDKLIELGADYAIDHRKEDWYKQVRDISKKIIIIFLKFFKNLVSFYCVKRKLFVKQLFFIKKHIF